jgi:hypothetical protein
MPETVTVVNWAKPPILRKFPALVGDQSEYVADPRA